MREETESPDETVLRRLREADTGNDTRNLRSYVVGGVEASQLSYEDWVRPLKLTGGRVCLRFDAPDEYRPGFVRWVAADRLEWLQIPDLPPVRAEPWEFKEKMADPDVTITPVPVEATPFAEEAGHDD